MTKQQQLKHNKKPRKNRLSKAEYQTKKDWYADRFPMCQHPKCNNLADDNHHVIWGVYKSDFLLANLCRFHHLWAHKNKKESVTLYTPIAEQNEVEYELHNN